MKRLIRMMACLMAVVMLAGGGMTVTARAATPYSGDIEVSDPDKINVKKTATGKAGGKITMSIVIKNDKKYYNVETMENARIKIGVADDNEAIDPDENDNDDDEDDEEEDIQLYTFPFETNESLLEWKNIGDVRDEKSVTISARLRRDLTEGYYQVPLYIAADNVHRVMVYFYIWVSPASSTDKDDEETDQDFEFTMGENQDTPYGIYPSVVNFFVNLRNSGLKKAYDVRMNMQLSEDITKFPFEISVANYDYRLGDMEVDQVLQVPYSMAIREDVKSGYYPIKFNIQYREDSTADLSEPIEKTFYVRIKGTDEDELDADANENERTKARIIVDSYETIPETVFAGQAFTLKVRMKNASSAIEASNIMLTFTPEEVESSPVFTTKNGSSSTVINSLAPGQSQEVVMDFEPGATVAQRSYAMTIKEDYDSPEFKNAKEEVKISIPVKQVARFNTGTIDIMPESIEVGGESNVMFDINNTGKVLLYNVMARFEADSIDTAEAYVGNIEPGKTGSVDALLKGTTPTVDDGKVKIIISYEDENGLVTETEKEMMLTVTEPMPVDFLATDADSMAADAESAGGGKLKWILIAALVILAGGGAAAFVHVRKKKKQAAEEEDIDDDEIS